MKRVIHSLHKLFTVLKWENLADRKHEKRKNYMLIIYRTIILPVVLYGCETWSLTLREERRLRVFENRC